MATAEQVATRFREFAAECRRDGLPLYGALSDGAAGEAALLELLGRARPGQARPVLLLAAVQRLLFDHPDDPLATFYPSVTGQPVPAGDPVPAFLAFCAAHLDELRPMVEQRSTQTNEVNRSVAVAAALRTATADLATTPIALVELGPSAGLNLRADTYAVDFGDGIEHQATASPVRLRTRLVGAGRPDVDRALPPVVARVGLDLHPIAVATDDEELRWLEACLWPEQMDRLARFRAAVAAVQAEPPMLVRGDLLDDLADLLARLPSGAHAFVFHSWVLTYVARDRRPELAEILRAAAAERPLSWFSAEAAGVVPGIDWPPSEDLGLTVLGLRRFRGAEDDVRLLGTSHPHLQWLDWLDGRS